MTVSVITCENVDAPVAVCFQGSLTRWELDDGLCDDFVVDMSLVFT